MRARRRILTTVLRRLALTVFGAVTTWLVIDTWRLACRVYGWP